MKSLLMNANAEECFGCLCLACDTDTPLERQKGEVISEAVTLCLAWQQLDATAVFARPLTTMRPSSSAAVHLVLTFPDANRLIDQTINQKPKATSPKPQASQTAWIGRSLNVKTQQMTTLSIDHVPTPQTPPRCERLGRA
jgi:hypothetical protein